MNSTMKANMTLVLVAILLLVSIYLVYQNSEERKLQAERFAKLSS